VALRLFFAIVACAGLVRAAEPVHTLVFFGDSLTFGYGLDDPNAQSYPALIQQKIDREGLPWHVVNAGLSGDTTSDGLRRINWVLRQHADVFVLALGSNDGLRGINPSLTQMNLIAMIDRVRKQSPGTPVILAGTLMPSSLGPDYVNAFDSIYPRVAQLEHVPLIPFLLAGVGGIPTLNQADGIHPNSTGAAIVANTVWKTLAPFLTKVKVRAP
jgi:acyl-CoA thioesterase-1